MNLIDFETSTKVQASLLPYKPTFIDFEKVLSGYNRYSTKYDELNL